MPASWDRIIIGAGAAGLMCAATAGYRGERVLVLDHANKAGKKILMSGGGRCNFTHLNSSPANFFSTNPHFCKSALSRYRPQDFLDLVERHGIEWVEKSPGQLFCRDSAKELLAMLLTECEWAGAKIQLQTDITKVEAIGSDMRLHTSAGVFDCGKLVVATGGLSIPTMGASGFGYDLARQFGLQIIEPRPALVPFTFTSIWKDRFTALAGLASEVEVHCNKGHYREPMLITHRGLSGPAMLQISSWWQTGQELEIDLVPGADVETELTHARITHPRKMLLTWLGDWLPKRLAEDFMQWNSLENISFAELSNTQLDNLVLALKHWRIKPAGTEGWRTAEVTMGGVSTDSISQKDFSVKGVEQLAFIGEVLDVTGELGGHNFQWAWASGVACAKEQ